MSENICGVCATKVKKSKTSYTEEDVLVCEECVRENQLEKFTDQFEYEWKP